jgi:hypothetical protein
VPSAATRYKRVWLLIGPQFPGQLREETAIRRLRKAFGSPRLRTNVGKFDVSSLCAARQASTSLPRTVVFSPTRLAPVFRRLHRLPGRCGGAPFGDLKNRAFVMREFNERNT